MMQNNSLKILFYKVNFRLPRLQGEGELKFINYFQNNNLLDLFIFNIIKG